MDIGIALPQHGTHARPETIAAFARDAEAAGFDSLWVGDRTLAPTEPSDVYPGGTPENPLPPAHRTFLDPLTVLTVAATATSRVRLGTSTFTAPLHPPVLPARALTTLDRVSGGRLDVGFGVGWLRDEYTATGADFGERGARLDEFLDVLHGIWTQEEYGHEGTYWHIPRSHFGLRPLQQPHPPVYLGGVSPAAMRRVGRRAAGWMGVVLPAEAHAALWETARRAAREAGRDPDALRQRLRLNPGPGSTAEEITAALSGVRDPGADCFIDLQGCVREPEEALSLGVKVLELLRGA
ncbi:TIGR03619 family F420-dependent LLM class oxidoreductase [Streptomyces gamaensis]|uniref:TIGR03619 family F420-dependent LLM class oxidoreductase n=1 Tax=Streptomyces gamaensis TaxID=1763542 RepID=A0ABW0YV65_9ACTN